MKLTAASFPNKNIKASSFQSSGTSLDEVLLFFHIVYIMITCPCNEHPLTPHFYIVKLGFTGIYVIFLFLL